MLPLHLHEHTSHRDNSSPRAIFFDAAGTLFHLREPVGETYARIALKHGVRAEPRALEEAFRAAWKALPSPLHPEGTPPADDDRAWWREVVRQTFAAMIPEEHEFAKMNDAFEP